MANLQIKFNGSAPLPGGVTMSFTYQNLAGQEIRADYTATSAQIAPSLGRPLSGGTKTVTIPIITPYSQYEPRRTQVDLRLGKNFNVGASRRLQANVDLYNVFNSNSVLARIDTYGRAWGQPTSFLPGRMLQLGAILTF
jgi:hypothetical protein